METLALLGAFNPDAPVSALRGPRSDQEVDGRFVIDSDPVSSPV